MELRLGIRRAVVLTVLALGACGPATTGVVGGAPSPGTATPSPLSPTTIHLVAADSGRTVEARVGDIVEVTLVNVFGVPGSSTTWDAATTDGAIMTRTASHANPSGGLVGRHADYVALFTMVGPGLGTITGSAHATCEAMNPESCKGPAALVFRVHVTA